MYVCMCLYIHSACTHEYVVLCVCSIKYIRTCIDDVEGDDVIRVTDGEFTWDTGERTTLEE